MVRTSEWWVLSYLAVGSLLAVVGVAVILAKQTVVLDSVGIRWSTAFRSQAVSWDQVVSIAAVDRHVSITWSAGTALLPIWARSSEAIGPEFPVVEPASAHLPTTLIASTRHAWIAQRGENWTPPELLPWVPSVEASGRVVLRPWGQSPYRMVLLAVVVWIVMGPILSQRPIAAELVEAVTYLAIAFASYAALVLWARVEVSDEAVVVRSFPFRVRRVSRSNITGMGVVRAPFPMGTGGVQHLALHTTSGVVGLPAPTTFTATPGYGDANFYRIWHWLDQELCSGGSAFTVTGQAAGGTIGTDPGFGPAMPATPSDFEK